MYFSFLLNIFISNPSVTLKCYIIKQTEKEKTKTNSKWLQLFAVLKLIKATRWMGVPSG